MMIARPARFTDLADIVRLAALAGPGFTSLAVGEEKLAERLSRSIASFEGPSEMSPRHVYLLVLEKDGMVVGLSAVKAQVGMHDPFFSFRVCKVAQKSRVADRRFDMDVLFLVNDYTGATEVGSLFVSEDQRGTGAGRLIAQARYMLMAADSKRFSGQVISELRGHSSQDGISPFWEAIGRKFFDMGFSEADQVSAEQDNQFILDLMPKHPIYTALLPVAAQEVIGQTHPAGIGARRFLEAEGFRYDGMIDIFDGGPTVTSPREAIRTIRDSQLFTVSAGEPATTGEAAESVAAVKALVSRDAVADFACVFSTVRIEDQHATLPAETIVSLGLRSGDQARIWINR